MGCPFQFDLCFALKQPKRVQNSMDPPATPDDPVTPNPHELQSGFPNVSIAALKNNQEQKPVLKNNHEQKEEPFVDSVGSIDEKLKKNGLKFAKIPANPLELGKVFQRTFIALFGKLKDQKNKIKSNYPHNERFMGLVDRRQYQMPNDSVYLYEPPLNCRRIPNNAVSEWYLNSSRTCLLPNMAYGDGSEAEKGPNKENKHGLNQQKLKNANIGSLLQCKGAFLTFSFHVKAVDEVKCYLYWNGQIIRFMPEDIRNVFPKIFNMDWCHGDNAKWLKKNEMLDGMLLDMKSVIKDAHFEGFKKSICC